MNLGVWTHFLLILYSARDESKPGINLKKLNYKSIQTQVYLIKLNYEPSKILYFKSYNLIPRTFNPTIWCMIFPKLHFFSDF